MTKFIDKTKEKESKPVKETVFEAEVLNKQIVSASFNPQHFDYVEFIGNSEDYGDVFKAYVTEGGDFSLFFGVKGDEFD